MKALGLLTIGLLLSFNVLAESEDFLFHGQAFEKVEAWKSNVTYSDREQGETCTPQPDSCGFQTLSRQICNNSVPANCWTETYQEYACTPQADRCSSWGSVTVSIGASTLIRAGVHFVNADFPLEIPFEYNLNKEIRIQPKSVPEGHIIGVAKNHLTKAELEKLDVDEDFNVKFFKVSEVRSDKLVEVKNITLKQNTLSSKITFNLKKPLARNEEIELILKRKVSRGVFKKPEIIETSLKGSLDKWAAIVMKKPDGSIDVELPAIKLGVGDLETKTMTLVIRHAPASHEGLVLFGDKDLLVSEVSAQVKLIK